MLGARKGRIHRNQSTVKRSMPAECEQFWLALRTPAVMRFPDVGFLRDKADVLRDAMKGTFAVFYDCQYF